MLFQNVSSEIMFQHNYPILLQNLSNEILTEDYIFN